MKQFVLALAAVLIFFLYQSWAVANSQHSYNGDQKSIYLLTVRRMDSAFLSRDYAYGNPDFLKFYTPTYLAILQFLIGHLSDYDLAMLVLHSLMLLVYLATMFLLLYHVTGDTWVALLLTFISSLARPAIASEMWGSVGLNVVIPRTAFLAIAPLLFWLLFRWLPKREWWYIPLLGFLGGLSANLHPPSGLFFVQILTTLALAFAFTSFTEVIWKLPLIGVMAMVGALPTLVPMFRNIFDAANTRLYPSFAEYYSIIHERSVSIFPFPPRQVTFFNGPLTTEWQSILAMVGIGLALGWLIWALRSKQQGGNRRYSRGLIIGLLAISLPFAYLATIFSALDLIITALAYWWVRLLRKDNDQLDLYILGTLACAAIYSFAGSATLGWIWQTFELWSLTPFYSEQARISRFVYLPLFIFMARWLVLLLKHGQEQVIGAIVTAGLVAGLIIRHWHFLDPWGITEWGLVASFLVLAIIGVVAGTWKTHQPWTKTLMLTISIMATMNLWLHILGAPRFSLLAAIFGLVAGSLYHFRVLSAKQWQFVAGMIVILSLSWLFFQGKLPVSHETPLRVQAYKALGLYQYSPPSQADQDASEMYAWIRDNTEANSLVYYDDRKLDLRSQAHRAATHGWKDLSAGYYVPPLLIEYYDRFRRLETAAQSAETLLACAVKYQADYIITKSNHSGLMLPLVFANGHYHIYSMHEVKDSEQLVCP